MIYKYLAVIAVVCGLVWSIDDFGYDRADAAWQQKWDTRERQIAEANLAHEKSIREKEAEYQVKLDEANRNGQAERKKLEGTIRDGVAITERLQHEYKKLAAQSKYFQNTTVANGSFSTDGPADMLAKLLSGAEQRETEIARYADELAIARNVCEASYNTLRTACSGPTKAITAQ